MTKNMTNFAKLMQNAENGRDTGINFLRKNIKCSSKVKGKLFGSLGIAYNKLEINDIDIDLSTPISSEIYVDKNYYISYKYIETFKVLDAKKIKKKSDCRSPFSKGVLKEGFDIVIAYSTLMAPLSKRSSYKILLQVGIDVFVVTKYGCYDIVTGANNSVSFSEALTEIFRKSEIRVCPSTGVFSKFKEKLDFYLEDIFIIDNGINPKLKENVKLNLSYNPIKSYKCVSNNYYDMDAADVFVDGKFLCYMKSESNTDVEVTIKTNIGTNVKFVTSIDTYALNAKISSSLLSKYILMEKNNNDDMFAVIDTSIIKGIKVVENNGAKYESIKNKYYSLFVHANSKDLYKLRRSIEYNLCKNVSFTKIENQERFLNNKLLIHNLSKNTVYETDTYIIALYDYYDYYRVYGYKDKIAVYLIENKQSKEIYILSVYYNLLQVSVGTKNYSLMELPMLFYAPYTSIMGNCNYIPYSFCNDKKIYSNSALNKTIYNTILNEFGNVKFELSCKPKVTLLESDILLKSFNKTFDMTFLIEKEKEYSCRNIYTKHFVTDFVDRDGKYIDINFMTRKFDNMAISDFLQEHKLDFYIANTILSQDMMKYLKNSIN